jgi:hypothetical protein
MFPITSRYYAVQTARIERPDGKTVVYLKRRFLPSPDRFSLLQEHNITDSERLDNIAAQYLGDPEQFWRICDANNAMNPETLVRDPVTLKWKIGRKLRITLPEGIQGATDA